MSIKLDPRDVLQCLNELGYYNIDRKQLKEFLKDLKTLIKHDIKKITEENQENIRPNFNHYYDLPHETYHSYNNNKKNNNDEDRLNLKTNEMNTAEVFDHLHSTSIKKITEENQENIRPNFNHYYDLPHETYHSYNNNKNDEDELNLKTNEINTAEVFDHLYSTSTISSRAKNVPKHNSIISIDIRKSKRRSEPAIPVNVSTENTEKTKSTSNNKISSYTTIDTKSEIDNNKLSTTNIDSKSNGTSTNVENRSSKECCCIHTESSCKKANTLKPKVSFIKPRRPVKSCKSDPVNLYQYYQKEWKKQKIPGEDKRSDLRWAIRERMLGEPDIPVQSTDKLKKSGRF